MTTNKKPKKWGPCVQEISDCMRDAAGEEANYFAWQAIRHMAEVLDYHIDQESGGAEYGVTAAVPPGMVNLYKLAATYRYETRNPS